VVCFHSRVFGIRADEREAQWGRDMLIRALHLGELQTVADRLVAIAPGSLLVFSTTPNTEGGQPCVC
jgi:hypothetical protein